MDELSILGALKVILEDVGIEVSGNDSCLLFKSGSTSSIRVETTEDELKIVYRDITNVRPGWTTHFNLVNPMCDPLGEVVKSLKSHHILPSNVDIPELETPEPEKPIISTRILDI